MKKYKIERQKIMKSKVINLFLSVLFITAFVCSSNFIQAKTINHKFVEENRKDIDDILLGNSSSKILNGGLRASYEDKYFYATDEGIRLVENSNEQIIISDYASYINGRKTLLSKTFTVK